jgi:hypothetical protein
MLLPNAILFPGEPDAVGPRWSGRRRIAPRPISNWPRPSKGRTLQSMDQTQRHLPSRNAIRPLLAILAVALVAGLLVWYTQPKGVLIYDCLVKDAGGNTQLTSCPRE